MSNTASIELSIEELILDGFSPADRSRIAEAVQHELARRFAIEGVPPGLTQGGIIPWLDGGEITLTHGMSAQAIGIQIARSLYGGLNEGLKGGLNEGLNE